MAVFFKLEGQRIASAALACQTQCRTVLHERLSQPKRARTTSADQKDPQAADDLSEPQRRWAMQAKVLQGKKEGSISMAWAAAVWAAICGVEAVLRGALCGEALESNRARQQDLECQIVDDVAELACAAYDVIRVSHGRSEHLNEACFRACSTLARLDTSANPSRFTIAACTAVITTIVMLEVAYQQAAAGRCALQRQADEVSQKFSRQLLACFTTDIGFSASRQTIVGDLLQAFWREHAA